MTLHTTRTSPWRHIPPGCHQGQVEVRSVQGKVRARPGQIEVESGVRLGPFWPFKLKPFDGSNLELLTGQTLTFWLVKHGTFDLSNIDLLTSKTRTFWPIKRGPLDRSSTDLLTGQKVSVWPGKRSVFDRSKGECLTRQKVWTCLSCVFFLCCVLVCHCRVVWFIVFVLEVCEFVNDFLCRWVKMNWCCGIVSL